MNEEKFTEDNEFGELKKLLKDLPKVNAPDNFEFNLMTRIRNENFEIKSEKKKSIFSWALTPAIAFAATVFLIVFIFTGNEDLDDNPWQTPPQLIEKSIDAANSAKPEAFIAAKRNNTSKKIKSNKKIIREKIAGESAFTYNSAPKDFPFDKRTSVDLDDYLNRESNSDYNGATQLTNSSSAPIFPFDGFFLREVKEVRKEDSLTNRSDSTSRKLKK